MMPQLIGDNIIVIF